MTRTRFRRVAAGVASVALVATGVVTLSASPASAASNTVTVPYRCITSVFNVGYDELEQLDVTLTAPTSVVQGDPIAVTYDLVDAPENVPVALGNAVFNASSSVTAQPATGGPVLAVTAATGPNTAPANVAPNAPLPITVSQSVSFATTSFVVGNNIRLRPSVLTVNIVSGDGGIGGGVVTCTPEPAPNTLNVYIDGLLDPTPDDQCTAQTGNTTGGPGCPTQQNLFSSILPGNLSQQATVTAPNPNSTTINLGSTTSSTSAQTLSAPMNAITVTDNRGGSFQWSLTATMTDFGDGTHSIDASQATITPACSIAASGSAPGALAGPPNQAFGGAPVSLCIGPSIPDVTSQTTGGQWNVTGPMSLQVPSFQAAGAYVAILTVNLA